MLHLRGVVGALRLARLAPNPHSARCRFGVAAPAPNLLSLRPTNAQQRPRNPRQGVRQRSPTKAYRHIAAAAQGGHMQARAPASPPRLALAPRTRSRLAPRASRRFPFLLACCALPVWPLGLMRQAQPPK